MKLYVRDTNDITLPIGELDEAVLRTLLKIGQPNKLIIDKPKRKAKIKKKPCPECGLVCTVIPVVAMLNHYRTKHGPSDISWPDLKAKYPMDLGNG